VAEREYVRVPVSFWLFLIPFANGISQTYLSISSRYTEYPKVLDAMFYRVLWKCGISKPREFASKEDLAAVTQGFADMEMRPGAADCIKRLRNAGFTVWGLTMDNLQRVSTYFKRSAIEMPSENLLSCDSTGIGKPAPEAYKPLFDRLGRNGNKPWFAAAHQWDTSAAGRVG
jgi:2-haloacid dehalogenase